MSSIAEMNSPYEMYGLIKKLYMSNGRGIGLELLEHYKYTHIQLEIEAVTLYVLYGAFNEMIRDSKVRNVQYSDVAVPDYSRVIIVDMVSLGYPVTQMIKDIDTHHAPNILIPFRERVLIQVINQSNRFNESAISVLIADYTRHI